MVLVAEVCCTFIHKCRNLDMLQNGLINIRQERTILFDLNVFVSQNDVYLTDI